jgi:hypothetical protein
MHCLSTKLPWAMLIVAGRKTIETREWLGVGAAQRLIGQRVAIHCGKSADEGAPIEARQAAYGVCSTWPKLAGCILGSAVLVDAFQFTQQSFEERQAEHWCDPAWWHDGLVGIEFAQAQRLDHPLRWRGELGFFELPEVVGKRLG